MYPLTPLSSVLQWLSTANRPTPPHPPENRVAFFCVCTFDSVPDAPRPVGGEYRLSLDTLDPIFPLLDSLRQIPKEKVNQHAAHSRARPSVHAQRSRDAFHSDDRRSANGHLFPRGVDPVAATRKLDARFEKAYE